MWQSATSMATPQLFGTRKMRTCIAVYEDTTTTTTTTTARNRYCTKTSYADLESILEKGKSKEII